jgi:hypothetical protein
MSGSKRNRSYWHTRRDIACVVDAHVCDLEEGHSQAVSNYNPSASVTSQDVINIEQEDNENSTCASDVDSSDGQAEDTQAVFFDLSKPGGHNTGSECDSASSVSSGLDPSCDSISEYLVTWANKFNITAVALGDLLHFLSKFHPELPLDPRTLLKTTRAISVNKVAGGMYSHIGILHNLQKLYETLPMDSCFEAAVLHIQINIDGLPIFKSSNLQLWPILGLLKGSSCLRPFTIGIYAGNQKPTNIAEFLQDFVAEFKLMENADFILGCRVHRIAVHSFVCDAPARAMLKQVKLHSGYHGCERCEQTGEWCGRVVFPQTNASLRANASFDELSGTYDRLHHTGVSPLRELSVGLVSQFCLDYMHLVCQGVMRKLLMLWMRGPLSIHCRLSAGILNQISEHLISLRHFIPSEFARRPRAVLEIDRWKATEFRQFLLYTGPVVLKGLVSETVYKHFMLLSVSMYLCLNAELCVHYVEFVRDSLTQFVRLAGEIYGKEVLVYNMHSLIHIADDVKKFGPLDNVSCFPFENELRSIKRLIRRPGMPLQQVICRLSEQNHIKLSAPPPTSNLLGKMHDNGPIPDYIDRTCDIKQYEKLNFTWCALPCYC